MNEHNKKNQKRTKYHHNDITGERAAKERKTERRTERYKQSRKERKEETTKEREEH